VNEETRTVEVAPDTPLLYVLRNELGLSNPHFGCGLAQCGACTVHVDRAPTRSCSLPVSAAAGTKVTTLGGLGTPEHPHPLQVAFIAEQGSVHRLGRIGLKLGRKAVVRKQCQTGRA
jgi:nicotinate dehydrogenase subunit A